MGTTHSRHTWPSAAVTILETAFARIVCALKVPRRPSRGDTQSTANVRVLQIVIVHATCFRKVHDSGRETNRDSPAD